MTEKGCVEFERDRKKRLFYFHEFETWDSAKRESDLFGDSYADEKIFDQVAAATEKVRSGEAVYEQDGICFNKMLVNYELLSSFLYVFAKEKKLDVIDFGGALGSVWFRYRSLWEELKEVRWTVVEQEWFVRYGKKNIKELNYEYLLEECKESANCVLLSSVLSYLEKPYEILNQVLERKIPYVVIDEQAFHPDGKHTVMLQNVPSYIYQAVYPAHLFSLDEFKEFVKTKGYKIWEWKYPFGNIPIRKNGVYRDTVEKGFLLLLDDGKGER